MVFGRILITWGSVTLIAGCAATTQASKVEVSGFLGSDTYALLQPGREGQAVLGYVNEDASFAKYDKIILEPVTIWGDPENPRLPPEDRAMLANISYTAFHEELAKDLRDRHGAGANDDGRATAITKAEPGDAALNAVSSIVPHMRGSCAVPRASLTEKPALVGEAQGEAKVTNLMTGELVGAGVDRHFGSQAPRVTTDSWGDVVAIIDYWSEWYRFRFCQGRGDDDCVAPKPWRALRPANYPSKEEPAHAFRDMPEAMGITVCDRRHQISVPSCTTDTLVSMRPGRPP